MNTAVLVCLRIIFCSTKLKYVKATSPFIMYEEDTAQECEDKDDKSGGGNRFVQSHHPESLITWSFLKLKDFLAERWVLLGLWIVRTIWP